LGKCGLLLPVVQQQKGGADSDASLHEIVDDPTSTAYEPWYEHYA